MARYTFGSDTAAVERLALVASAYEPVSRSFLVEHRPDTSRVVLDLGCGPGFTTSLLREVYQPRELVGIDASAQFLAVARDRLPDARFAVHDVTLNPLPSAPADLIYARLLLAHLPDPLAIAQGWSENLQPGGFLLIEDLEAIEAPPGPLQAYDRLAAHMVRSGGGTMYAGQALAPLGGRCTPVTVPVAHAARIYLVNVQRWLADPANPLAKDQLEDLSAGLGAYADGRHAGTVSWIVRQIAVMP